MNKKPRRTLLKIVIASIILSYLWLFYEHFGSFIPYTRTHFSSYEKFFDAGFDVTVPKEQPEYCKNIKYYYRHGIVQEKAFYCTVDSKADIDKLRDMLEKDHGLSAPTLVWDPHWLKTYEVKNTHINFYYVHITDREDKEAVSDFDIYNEKIRPFVIKLIPEDEGWHCVSLYEETYSNSIETYGIMANESGELIEFDRYERIYPR